MTIKILGKPEIEKQKFILYRTICQNDSCRCVLQFSIHDVTRYAFDSCYCYIKCPNCDWKITVDIKGATPHYSYED